MGRSLAWIRERLIPALVVSEPSLHLKWKHFPETPRFVFA